MPKMVPIVGAWVNPLNVCHVTQTRTMDAYNIHMLNGTVLQIPKYNGAIVINDEKMIIDAIDRGLNTPISRDSADE